MVKIYSIDDCPYCTELKDRLTAYDIDFEEVNVDLPENELEFKAIYEATNSDNVPVVRIGQQLLVPEISFTSIEEAAELTKKFLSEINP